MRSNYAISVCIRKGAHGTPESATSVAESIIKQALHIHLDLTDFDICFIGSRLTRNHIAIFILVLLVTIGRPDPMQRIAELVLHVVAYVDHKIGVGFGQWVALAEDFLLRHYLNAAIVVRAPDVVLEIADVDPPVAAAARADVPDAMLATRRSTMMLKK
jgi:hypothetical protein